MQIGCSIGIIDVLGILKLGAWAGGKVGDVKNSLNLRILKK